MTAEGAHAVCMPHIIVVAVTVSVNAAMRVIAQRILVLLRNAYIYIYIYIYILIIILYYY